MAADNRSVVITLRLEQTSDADVGNQVDTESVSQKNDKDSSGKAAYKAMAMQALNVALSEVTSWAEYYWNRELALDDDYIGQRNKRVILTQISRASSAAATVGSFALIGSAAGPAGAVIGALLGTAVAASGIARSNIQGKDQQDIQIRQMNAQLQFTRSRAGWSLQAASIGEDL